jgi:hypothetical protein
MIAFPDISKAMLRCQRDLSCTIGPKRDIVPSRWPRYGKDPSSEQHRPSRFAHISGVLTPLRDIFSSSLNNLGGRNPVFLKSWWSSG